MCFLKKIVFLLIFFVIFHVNSLGNIILSVYDRSQYSDFYLFESNLIFNGSVDRLICVYRDKANLPISFTDISNVDLAKMRQNNVRLIYFAPRFDLEEVNGSIDNKLIEEQLRTLSANRIYIWADVLGANLFPPSSKDVSVLNDRKTEKAWMDAVDSLDEASRIELINLARAWDIRLELLLKNRITTWSNYFCEFNGLRVANNPIFGVWSFESDWLDRMLAGEWRELPSFFIDDLTAQWNYWVYNEKVKSTSEFKQKYGFLVKGESVENFTLKLVAYEKHPIIKEDDDWITLSKKTLSIYKDSPRDSLQREFFIYLYNNHISRIKSRFEEQGIVSRDAPYFITMSAKNNEDVELTNLYVGSNKRPYIYYFKRFDEDKNKSFSSAKQFVRENTSIRESSIIMLPNSVINNITPYEQGITCFGTVAHPNAVERFGIPNTQVSHIEEDFILDFNSPLTNSVDGIEFKIVNKAISQTVTNVVDGVVSVSEQVPVNDDFKVSVKYIKVNKGKPNNQNSQVYILLDYDVSLATYIQFHVFGNSLACHTLHKSFTDDKKTEVVNEIDERGAFKINLSEDLSYLFIKKNE